MQPIYLCNDPTNRTDRMLGIGTLPALASLPGVLDAFVTALLLAVTYLFDCPLISACESVAAATPLLQD